MSSLLKTSDNQEITDSHKNQVLVHLSGEKEIVVPQNTCS